MSRISIWFAEIKDTVHVQKYPVWQGDSLQFALAYAAPPDANTTVKADAAFNDRGHSWIFPSGPLGFDRQSLQKFSRICMTRQGERSVYELQLPWKYIRFVKPADRVFRFSMLANNNDDGRPDGLPGMGRRPWAIPREPVSIRSANLSADDSARKKDKRNAEYRRNRPEFSNRLRRWNDA